MKICYLDAFSGISGDMTVGALIDALIDTGAGARELVQSVEALATGAKFEVEKTKRRGIAASKFRVILSDAAAEGKTHRHLHHILDLIAKSAISDRAKQNASAVFQRLGEAEAKVHDIPIEKVHFHEVGAVDSICDIVGACVGFDLLGIGAVYCSPINVGSGTVKTEHGVLPVPAPATAELLAGKPIYARGPSLELTTPTGAAIAATLATEFGALPPMRVEASGFGAGDYDFPEHANVLRVLIGATTGAEESTTVAMLEANIDDSTPQVLGYAMERLFEAGALDVTLASVLMKKSRPGTLLSVIARPEDRETLARIIFEETTTLGLRIYAAERRVKGRSVLNVETPHGTIRIKVSEDGSFAPEYEDCRDLAKKTGTPLKQILAEANLAYLKNSR
jgi:pyridinium-3,5-bisthiocarboxylic acid mononucleotide nickel chelatase